MYSQGKMIQSEQRTYICHLVFILRLSLSLDIDLVLCSHYLVYRSSSIDLANLAAVVYSTQLCHRLRAFLSAVPPSCPLPHVNELLIAVSDFERNLDSWGIRFDIIISESITIFVGTHSFSLTVSFYITQPSTWWCRL